MKKIAFEIMHNIFAYNLSSLERGVIKFNQL